MGEQDSIEEELRRIEAQLRVQQSSFYRAPASNNRPTPESIPPAALQANPVLYSKPRVVLKVMGSSSDSSFAQNPSIQSASAFFPSATAPPAGDYVTMPSAASIQKVIQNDMDAARKMKMRERGRKRKFVRSAGGEVWEDDTLQEWDPDDFRLFCGDLGNEVNDDTLANAFKQYPSFQRAKVVRDKRSGKTKGFGFVSFHDSQDFIKAMREMNGRYVGNRPIKLRKSNWRDRNIEVVKKKQKEKSVWMSGPPNNNKK